MLDREDDEPVYLVVVNHEGQYSLWSKDQPLPPGWRDVGKDGSKAECLGYIEKVWTDMRPLSLRKRMDAFERGG